MSATTLELPDDPSPKATPPSSPARAAVRPGDILAGKYRVERVLGSGGMGVVAAAEHIELNERVALKLMLPEALENPEAVERFLREARAAVKIKGEHVAKVTDVGRLEGGEPYIVMEYLEGDDLHALLAKKGTLPVGDAIEHVLQACEAVAEAHSLGIIHRDLKPSNLFLARRPDGTPTIKVLDFGISKVTPVGDTPGGGDLSMTRTKQPLGTPLYMSPEQMASARNADARSDVWSLGVILFELTSGEPPFNGTTFHELRRKIAQDPVPSIRALRPDAPRKLEAVILRCLEKEPARRYQNIADLAADLVEIAPARAHLSAERIARIIEKAGLASTIPNLSAAPPDQATLSASVAETLDGARAERGRWTLAVLGAALFVAALVTAVIALSGGTPAATPSQLDAPKGAASPATPTQIADAPAPAPSVSVSAAPSAAPPEVTSAGPPSAAEPQPRRPKATISIPGVSVGLPGRAAPTASAPAAAPAPTSPPSTKPKDMLLDAELK